MALGVLFVAPLLPGANGTAYAQATGVTLSVSPDEVGESAGATVLTVVGTLNGGAFTQNTAVALTVSAGTAAETDDYAAGTATLTILAGQTAGTATLTLTPVDDDIDEEDETVIVKGTVTGLEVTPDTVTITDNDSAGVTVSHSALGVYPFARAHYTVVLDSQPSGTVTVSVEGGSSDIEVVSPSTLTFNERTWSTPQTVTVYARLNTDPEILDFVPPHTLTHTVTGYGSVTEAANVTVTVGWEYDDDRPGVSVSPWTIDIRAPEGGAADSYTVVLDTEPSGTVTVTVHGAGDDLTVSPSPLTFDGTNWATAQTVTVEAVDDAIAEGQERIRLTHTVAGYSDEFYGDVTRARSVTVKVVDNDTAGVTVSPTSISAAEGAAAGSYTVVLDSEPSGMVTVTVGGAGDDVTVSPSTLTFDGTTWATAQTVTVEAVDDALTEGEEEVTLTHTARDGGYDGVRIAGLAVTVDDNDAAGVTVGPTSISATEGAAAGSYQVVLDSQPSGTVTVTVGGAGSDVSVSPSPLTFDGTTWATAQTVTVTAVDDALAEGQEEVTLTHTVAGYGDVTEAADVTVTVVDDDAAGVTVGPTSISATEGGGAGFYTVVLNTVPSGTVTVTVGGAGDDLTVSPSPLTFDGTTWATAQTVTVTAVDDALAEGQEEVALTHTVVGYGGVTEAGDVTVTVVDNDTAGVTVSHRALTVTVFGRAHYTVVLDSQPSGTVTVTVGGGSADVEVSPSTLTFNESTWGMAQTVSVFAALGTDQDLEYVLPHTLTHTVTDYGSVTEGPDVTVTVVDDETLRVAVNPTSISADEGGATQTYAMVLQSEPSAPVTVDITTDGDVSVSPRQLRFTAADWFTPRTVTVRAGHDGDDENDEVTLTHAMTSTDPKYDGQEASPVVVTVLDDDVPIVSATFGAATASAPEGASVEVTVGLSQAPEREVVLPIGATRGANLAAAEVEGVPADVTFAADATQARFTVTFPDDAAMEGNETLTLTFGTYPGVRPGANPQLVLTVTDDDGPPLAPDVAVQTGDGYAALSWAPVANDSPVTRYEVRWRESDGGTFGAWKSVGLDTSYRVEGLANGKAYEFEVRAVNAHGDGEWASAPGTPTARLTGIPKAVQVLNVKATDSGRAELSWTGPANGTDRVTANSATATFAQLQGYRIEVCRTPCDDWYAVVPNTRKFEHKYVHQVLAPGVIRENRYRVQAININGKTGPWSNVATLDPTVVENFRVQTPDSATLWVRFRVRNPDGNKLYVRYTNTGTGAVAYTERRLRKKGDVKLDLTGLAADSWYRVDLDFSPDFDSPRKQSRWYGTAKEGHTPLTSPYAVDALDAQVFAGGQWRDASDNALYVRMGGTGKYRVRLKPCSGIHDVIVRRIQAPAGRLRASPMDTDSVLMTNLSCESEFDDWRRDEKGDPLTMDQVYDMTNFPDRAKDRIPIYAGTPNNWYEVTVTARALEDYPADRRHDALLSAPFAVVYNHEVWKEVTTSSSYLVSEGTGLVRVSLDRPADATLPEPSGVTIARAAGASGGPVMRWDAVPGATGYKVEWRHGVHYSNRANQNRSLQTATSVTLPLGGSWRGPITARVRAYSSSGVSGWVERTWDSRPPTLNVLDTAVNEADGSVGFLVTLSPAASGQVTVDYATTDDTAVAGTDYTATSGTVTFAPGQTRKSTAQVPITDDGEEDSGETFRLVLSNPAGSDANNGAAVLGDADAVATILNSEQEPAELTGFTLVDAGTNGDLMVLAAGSTVALGEWLAPSYGIRAEMGPGAAPGSVRLALSGAKTVTYTDDAAPYSLYGDGAGRVNGEALPPGAYTLTATAYADSGGRGEERGSLEVSFTVAAGALSVTTPGPFTVAEGETAVTELAASQTGSGGEASWSIPERTAGGADRAAFTLTAEGVLSLVAAKDFEAPDDADGDGVYAVTVEVREGAQSATAALSVTLTDVEEVPLSVTTPGPFMVAEGTTAVAELAASDTGTGVEASWSIPEGTAGGADGAAFALTPEGVLSLVAAKDFETPDDADGDGTYEVTVEVAVPAAVAAGAQSATAALLVTLTDVNEAPVAQATAAPERVREGAEVTLDGRASTDPDAEDTLSHAWTQADDGAPRVTLSDASAAQPVFTSPSDLAAETELAFTLGVTDAEGLYAEDTVTVTVSLVSEVSIAAASGYAAGGHGRGVPADPGGERTQRADGAGVGRGDGRDAGLAGAGERGLCGRCAGGGAAGADGGGRGVGE